MALYAIGDVQGCYKSLLALLKRIRFNANSDRLWFVGDLVNRGPDSLGVLRFIKALDGDANVVLGNHDLNLLALAVGARKPSHQDTLQSILDAEDCQELLSWLRARPLLLEDKSLGMSMVHAAWIPDWTLDKATALAHEVEIVLRSDEYVTFLHRMYGDTPDLWSESLRGWDRLRFITNVFTRMRYCDQQGRIDLTYAGPPGTQPATLKPWYEWPNKRTIPVVFGHWSSLGAKQIGDVVCVDSGCVWGGRLTAVRLDKKPIELISVAGTL